MDQPEQSGKLDQAAQALQAGQRDEARRILDELVFAEPKNVAAWQMLAKVVKDPFEKKDCLAQVVRLRPDDQAAIQALKSYEASPKYRQAKNRRKKAEKQAEERADRNQHYKAMEEQDRGSCLLSTAFFVLWAIIELIFCRAFYLGL